MFEDLFASADKEIEKKQSAISEFLRKSNELRDRYEEGGYLYKNDMHSVTSYLFLYAPEQNYIFKASHARAFADCIEFYDDWGSGDSVKLNVYYRMCDQVADAIKASPAMMKTDASRFENGWGIDPKTFIADTEKHLLVFDVMYCCSTYELFSGITFKHLNAKEKQLLLEKKEKAIRYAKELREAQGEFEKLQEALDYLSNVFKTGEIVQHKKYGKGTVVTVNVQEDRLEVEFTAGEKKKLGMVLSIVNNIISSLHEDYAAQMQTYRNILKKKSTIEKAVSYAEKNFEEYANWLN